MVRCVIRSFPFLSDLLAIRGDLVDIVAALFGYPVANLPDFGYFVI